MKTWSRYGEECTHRNDALVCKRLDLRLPLLLPVADVLIVPDAKRAAREDDGADIVIEAGGANSFLVRFGSTGFFRKHETRTNPDGRSAEHQGAGERLAVVETSSGNELNGLASELGRWSFCAEFGDTGDQDACGDVALSSRSETGCSASTQEKAYSMATAFTSLSADHISSKLEALLHVLDVADHVLDARGSADVILEH